MAPTTNENAKPVTITPGTGSSAIFTNRLMKSRSGISSPPPKRMSAALAVTSAESVSVSDTIGANSVCPAMPSAMATTKDGSGVLSVA